MFKRSVGYYQRIDTIYGEMLIVVIHPESMSRETARHYAAHYVTLPEVDDEEVHRTPLHRAPAALVNYFLSAVRRAKELITPR